MLTVGLDLRPTAPGFKAHYGRGTGRYAGELTAQLLALTEEDPEPVFSIVPVDPERLHGSPAERSLVGRLPFGRQTVENQLLVPRRIAGVGADLIHFFSHGDAPFRCPVPYVVTVLDLIPLRFPELYRANKPNWRFKLARHLEHEAVRRSVGVIAISEATKRDVAALLGVPASKIAVTHLAVREGISARDLSDDEFEPARARAAEKLDLPADRPIVLCLGGIDPRKNILFLLRAFSTLLAESALPSRPLLVCCGSYEHDDQYPKFRSELHRLGLEGDVVELGFVEEQQLTTVYHCANVLAFPSLFEGFGLPVLEAMAAGVPVVAGNNSSIPEVAGSSAVLVPDNDLERWVRALERVLGSVPEQLSLGRAGVERALAFSWRSAASQTVDAYRQFVELSPELRGRVLSAEVRRNAA